MDQIQVQVVEFQVFQRLQQSTFDMLRIVESVPQLWRDEKVAASDDSLVDLCTDCISYLILVTVGECTIWKRLKDYFPVLSNKLCGLLTDVPVSGVNCMANRLVYLSRWRLQAEIGLSSLITLIFKWHNLKAINIK